MGTVRKFTCTIYFLFSITIPLSRIASGRVAIPDLGNYQFVQDGDISIAAMLGVHQYSADSFCSSITPASWVIGPEAFIYAVNQINRRKEILPNITLGLVILDDCEKDTTALACAAQLVPVKDQPARCKADDMKKPLVGSRNITMTTPSALEEDGNEEEEDYFNVVGVVGPDYSRSAVMISGLLSLFEIPVLGTFTTSDELSDKSRYPFFTRLVPPDIYLTEAIMDISEAFNWTYISLVFGEGSYGENAARYIEKIAKDKGICLAVSHRIASEPGEDDYEVLVDKLTANRKARAVIVIGETHIIAGLFKEVSERDLNDYFLWLFGDGFSFFLDEYIDTDIGRLAINAIHIDHPVGQVHDFQLAFRNLTPWDKPLRPWMQAFWKDTYNCDKDVTDHKGQNASTQETTVSSTDCANLESIGNYTIDNWYISRYIDGVNVYAKALDSLIREKCPPALRGNKTAIEGCIKGSDLLEFMRNVKLGGFSDQISFDENGDMYGSYVIHQIQAENGSMQNKNIGKWSRINGIVSLNGLKWDLNEWTSDNASSGVPDSTCSYPCGEKEYIIYSEVPCCWTCSQCRENERLEANKSRCEQCDLYTWPDETTALTCLPIEPNYMTLDYSDQISLGLFSLGALSTAVSFSTLVDYGLKKNSKLIKATSRELSTVILIGTQVGHVLLMLFVVKPNKAICIAREVGFHFATFLMYCPLMLKTIRIYRIFRGGQKGNQKIKYSSARFQMIVLSCLVIIQVATLGTIQLIWQSDSALQMPHATEKYVELYCHTPLIGFIIPLCLTIACLLVTAVFGYLIRKLPENYNESLHIFVSVSTTLFMWAVLLPTYYSAFYASHKAALLGLCLLINGFITLVCQFIPKLYAVRFVDEARLKVHYITSGSVAPTASTSGSAGNTAVSTI